MKVIHIFLKQKSLLLLVLNLIIILCLLEGCHIDSKDVVFLKNQSDFSKVLFFETDQGVIGIDPTTFATKIHVRFNTFVTYGDRAADGRIFVSDDGKGIGDWGKQVFVLNRKNLLVHTLSVFPNSRNMKVLQNRLILGNSSYTSEGYSGLQIFDLNTYEKLYETKDVGNIFLERDIHGANEFAYIGIPAFSARSRSSYIMRIDLTSMERKDLYEFTADHPYDRYNLLISNGQLIIAFNESREIQVFDLNSGKRLQKVSVADQMELPNTGTPEDYWLSGLEEIGSDLVLFLTDNLPDHLYQQLLIFDRNTLELKKNVVLDTSQNLRFFECCYVVGDRLWVRNGEYICVYEYKTGKLAKEIYVQPEDKVR